MERQMIWRLPKNDISFFALDGLSTVAAFSLRRPGRGRKGIGFPADFGGAQRPCAWATAEFISEFSSQDTRNRKG
jgi:hypothetical protein